MIIFRLYLFGKNAVPLMALYQNTCKVSPWQCCYGIVTIHDLTKIVIILPTIPKSISVVSSKIYASIYSGAVLSSLLKWSAFPLIHLTYSLLRSQRALFKKQTMPGKCGSIGWVSAGRGTEGLPLVWFSRLFDSLVQLGPWNWVCRRQPT